MADDRPGKLSLLFFFFLVLLNYPIMRIADRQELFMGVPKQYFFFFAVWSALIFLTARVVRRRKR